MIASGVRREHGFARDPDASCIGTSLGAQEEIPLYSQSSVPSKLFLTGGCAGDGRCRRERRHLPHLRASRGRRGTPGRVWRRRGARRAAPEGRKVVPSKNRPRIASLGDEIDAPPESISAVLAAEGRPERVSRAWQKDSSARATQPELWPKCVTHFQQNTGRLG